MTTAENEVHAQEMETFTVCAPRPGAPTKDAIQGVPMLSWELPASAADQLERTIRLLSHDVRRGRPMIYRGIRKLLAERPADEEEREILAARSSARDPMEADVAVEVIGMKTLRRELGADIEARRRELEEVNRRIADARGMLAKEEERQAGRVAAAHAHGQKLVREAQDHYEAQLRKVWSLETDLEQRQTDGMKRLGEQVSLTTTIKQQMDRTMRAQTAGELLGQLKGGVEMILNSPMGQAGQTALAAKLSAMVSNRMAKVGLKDKDEKPVEATTEDALMAIVLQGKQFRERRALLIEMEVATPSGNWRAAAMALGVAFVAGEATARAVAEFIGKGNAD